jgi:hypothetical protein
MQAQIQSYHIALSTYMMALSTNEPATKDGVYYLQVGRRISNSFKAGLRKTTSPNLQI